VPVLFVLGQPIRLAGDLIAPLLRTRVVSVLTFPPLALALYAAVLVGTHLTGFQPLMLTHEWLHELEIVLYLGSGYLFFLSLLGHEPLTRRLSYPLRVFLLLLGMTADTVVGVLLMMTTREPFPAYARMGRTWGTDLLSDIHTGGGIMWVVGDGLMFAVTVLVVAQWMRDTERQNDTGQWLESARRSTLANLGVDAVDQNTEADIDDDDATLAAYNRMLAKLSQRDRGA
jgi:putative copper resistance protein D